MNGPKREMVGQSHRGSIRTVWTWKERRVHMHYCGACGSPLTAVAIAQGICFSCGAAIEDPERGFGAAGPPALQGGALPERRPSEDDGWGFAARLPSPPPGSIRASPANTPRQEPLPEEAVTPF